jgi:hypothetical protein
MEKAVVTMVENFKEKTGYSLAEWKIILAEKGLTKHGEIVKFLKETHNITHGYASEIGLKVLGSDADSTANTDELIVNQYKGKEHLMPMYEKILAAVKTFGSEFEIAPKKAYVALRRKKQFIILNPASKTRFEIGFNLKGTEAKGKLKIKSMIFRISIKRFLTG